MSLLLMYEQLQKLSSSIGIGLLRMPQAPKVNHDPTSLSVREVQPWNSYELFSLFV